jgi:CheY-like chemotaxis protein
MIMTIPHERKSDRLTKKDYDQMGLHGPSRAEYQKMKNERGNLMRQKRVLLVEDDDKLRAYTAELMIRCCGCGVVTAKSGEEALRILEAGKESGERFDIVSAPLWLGSGMKGPEFITKAKQLDRGLHTILLCNKSIESPIITGETSDIDTLADIREMQRHRVKFIKRLINGGRRTDLI